MYDSYARTTGNLWQYCRDEPDDMIQQILNNLKLNQDLKTI